MKSSYFVSTPIYYVNGAPHIGHAYTSIAADVLARFHRLDGKDVFFLTGTDEHGQKVEKAAHDAGVSPGEFVDRVAADFQQTANTLGISYDMFIRTTEERHAAACAALWQKLVAAGQIYLGSYAGWYSVRDEAFYGEDELVRQSDGSLVAPTGAPVEWLSEPSYFFKLSAWQDRLLQHYDKHRDFIGPGAKRNEVISFVKSGLKDLSISRTTFSWGVPVPGDSKHVMYVWFDALVNYISALDWPSDTSIGSRWARYWPADLHLVGKEISRFHAVYWPAFLMAADLEVPVRIFSHGWWTVDGEKISKSAGNGIDPRALVEEFGLDPVRFFLLREVPFGKDGDFSRSALISRLNVELANDLGNLGQRSLSLIARQLNGLLPEQGPRTPDDEEMLSAAEALIPQMRSALAAQAFGDALEAVWRVVRGANAYIDRNAPWSLRKSDTVRMGHVLRVLADVIRVVATVLQPFMPTSMARLLDQLGVAVEMRDFASLTVPTPGQIALPAPTPIFPRFVSGTAAQ